jgi:hypothetical protein
LIIITGSPETQTELLHKHLAKYPRHSHKDWHQRSVTGSVWEGDWRRRQNKLKKALYAQGNECSDEQRMAYELLFGCDGYKSRNVCLVGVPASGKTWIAKKLSKLLECIFFNPGEVIRCGPLGRVACSFHPDARTIHSTLQLRPNRLNQYPESLEELQAHLNCCPQERFDQLKVLIVSEALMCTGPHLEALLLHIKKTNPNCIFLFDGDCQQVTMKPTTGYPSQPFVTRHEFEVVCPETTIIILEKCTKHRIRNPEKLQHLSAMRNGSATEATVRFFQQTKRGPQHKQPIIRLFANSIPASKFNEEQLTSILRSSSSSLQKLYAKDTLKGTKDVVKMTATEEASLPVDEVIRVIKGAPILIVQNHLAELISGQKVYVGNGTTGVFWEYDAALDAIFAKVNIASKELFVRIKRREFSTTTKIRSQFPFMLAWAATIHKVQGMEFDCIEVDFCLDAMRNSGASDFYQGLAYMALSRAETVIVQGRLTETLLNNINRQSLQWWNRQLSKWLDFKRTKSKPSRLFRNAIQMHNWHASASQRQVHKIVTAPATAPVTDSENVRHASAQVLASVPEHLADVGDFDSNTEMTLAPSLAPDPATDRHPNSFSTSDFVSASASHPVLTKVPKPNFDHTAAPVHASVNNQSPTKNALDPSFAPAPAAAKKRSAAAIAPPASASASAPASAAKRPAAAATPANQFVSAERLADALNSSAPAPTPVLASVPGSSSSASLVGVIPPTKFTSLFMAPIAKTKRRPAPASNPTPANATKPNPGFVPFSSTTTFSSARRPVHTPALDFDVYLQHRQGVKNVEEKAWGPRRDEFLMRSSPIDPTLTKTLATLLSNSRESVKVPQLFRCSEIGHPDTYGEVTPELVTFMMQQHGKLVARASEYTSTFVDLGSGIGGVVCFIAGLRKFKACFGVEYEPNRASFADPLVRDFLGQLQRRSMGYSDINIRFGDFLKCQTTLKYLQRASLVWVNNVAFVSINFQLLTILDQHVPLGCVVMSFVSFLPRLDHKNDSGFDKILEYRLPEAADWTGTPQIVHVMQKKR